VEAMWVARKFSRMYTRDSTQLLMLRLTGNKCIYVVVTSSPIDEQDEFTTLYSSHSSRERL
jgi:hypothetical protein